MSLTPSQRLCDTQSAVIASAGSLTPAYNLKGRILMGIYMPALWTAAGLTFLASYDGVTYYDVYDTTGEVSITAAAAAIYIALDATKFFGVNFIKVRSGTAGVPVAQAAERTMILMCGFPTPAH